ncbi:DUF4412 domain-containing protein [Mucilaginibacter sp. HMF5004]|uniref:DUF4412 domain-containing protein n=1 Tax=Mucilaginibacter rivuli TaxID=2857527 RepID=UPI001C5FEA7E|nr:DUF4412 domain-containing protein [Mucilaginibacter rivuli]MBW4889929.1 DUF4412 domain-containing protein [Mucilaginibacter rivuli]
MNILSIKNVALTITLAASIFTASAQKKYNEGIISYNISVAGQNVESKCSFKGDSSLISNQYGPAKVQMVIKGNFDYFAVLVDVPVASIKKAAVMTPGELEEAASSAPEYTITATTETKKIGDYNCKKYIEKDNKSGVSFDAWITTDISLPANILTGAFKDITGTPIQFTYVQQGTPQSITLVSVSEVKIPAETFSIPKDFERVSMDDMKAMMNRGKK